VPSYLSHPFGTNLQFAPGEFNFVKTRAQYGTKEAFRLRDEYFDVTEPLAPWRQRDFLARPGDVAALPGFAVLRCLPADCERCSISLPA
jgi:hypothetical protein